MYPEIEITYPLQSLYPVGSVPDGSGGLAGENLISSFEVYLDVFWLGAISIIVFIGLQFLVFFDAVKFISSLSAKKVQKKNKVPEKKSVIKEVVKPKTSSKTETKKPLASEPEVQITEQKDFLAEFFEELEEEAEKESDS